MLIVEKIVKYFNRGTINEVQALAGVDLIVERGDFITVIGSNGAGKSTMLNAMAGVFTPDSGRIVLQHTDEPEHTADGETRTAAKDITHWPEFKRAQYMGRVFQDPLRGTCASLSIEENMALALKRGKRRGLGLGVKDKDRALYREQLSQLGLGLEDRLGDTVGLLSGGQRQALTMLMATLVRPDILLLDEHTAALDPKTAAQILTLTEKIVESQRLTTLMVTHNMHQALSLGNRLVMLHGGEIIYDVEGEDKKGLTVEDLLRRFYEVKGEEMVSDRMLLA